MQQPCNHLPSVVRLEDDNANSIPYPPPARVFLFSQKKVIITAHIIQQILDWSVVTALTSIFSAGGIGGLLWRQLSHNKRQDNALLALLHFRLYANAEDTLRKGYTTVADVEDLENLYRAYKSLGGNGTGEKLYRDSMALPVRKDDIHED